MNFEKMKNERKDFGSWKGKVKHKILEMVAENMDLVKRVEMLEREKELKEKEVERMLRKIEEVINKSRKELKDELKIIEKDCMMEEGRLNRDEGNVYRKRSSVKKIVIYIRGGEKEKEGKEQGEKGS